MALIGNAKSSLAVKCFVSTYKCSCKSAAAAPKGQRLGGIGRAGVGQRERGVEEHCAARAGIKFFIPAPQAAWS